MMTARLINTVTTTHSGGVTTQTVTSTNKETGKTTTETSTDGNSDQNAAPPPPPPPPTAATAPHRPPPPPPPPPPAEETSTPDPEGGDGEEMPVIVVGGRPLGVSPGKVLDQSGQPLDYRKSMMQPVDEDGYGEGKPKPVHLEEALDASLDPNINWGDDSSGGLSSPELLIRVF